MKLGTVPMVTKLWMIWQWAAAQAGDGGERGRMNTHGGVWLALIQGLKCGLLWYRASDLEAQTHLPPVIKNNSPVEQENHNRSPGLDWTYMPVFFLLPLTPFHSLFLNFSISAFPSPSLLSLSLPLLLLSLSLFLFLSYLSADCLWASFSLFVERCL